MKRKLRPEIDYTGWTKEQHIEHLKKEPAYQQLLEKIDGTDIVQFLDEYATLKAELYEKKEAYSTTYERHKTQFLNKADAYIDKILHKKLFNLQCKWRANLIQLPLIKMGFDFDYWEKYIRECPFIPPITEREIEICIQFLNEEIDWDDNEYQFVLWQNYDGFKMRAKFDSYSEVEKSIYGMEHGCNEHELPKLYEFFDKYQNTGNLMFLEDIRGPIEEEYLNKCDEIDAQDYERALIEDPKLAEEMYDLDENGVDKTIDYFQFLNGLKWESFIEQSEDMQTRELFKQSKFANRKNVKVRFFERNSITSKLNDTSIYFNFLEEFNVELPIESNDNWRISLEKTARKFQQTKVAEMLPYAYEAYLIGLGNYDDIPKLISERVAAYKYDTESTEYKLMEEYRDCLLQGREGLTGKRDFDYL